MSDISVLGIFVADISFSGDKIPTTGETIRQCDAVTGRLRRFALATAR